VADVDRNQSSPIVLAALAVIRPYGNYMGRVRTCNY
jgi:hypothetical protein